MVPDGKGDKERLGNDKQETKTKVKTKRHTKKANDEGQMKLNPVIFLPMMTGPREDRRAERRARRAWCNSLTDIEG